MADEIGNARKKIMVCLRPKAGGINWLFEVDDGYSLVMELSTEQHQAIDEIGFGAM
ncbi:hypothetical protein CCACVL1_03916 [Corchorus capsularis]|uniref:Uncharacterized protein n=1 Tax=Corchorus capsularis TaxID=210143 RepID=A0A1R3JWB1_COCAP|nr:hypothetical protein CCACVL1_03916 [Corchorus capsularis]